MAPCFRPLLIGLIATTLAGGVRAASPAPGVDPLTKIEPFAATAAFAASHGIPLQGIAASGSAGPARLGDEVTFLITRYHGSTSEQWIARARSVALTEVERNGPPRPDAITYSGTGRTLRFGFTPTALQVAFGGPFRAADLPNGPESASRIGTKRLITNAQYLDFGLDEFARVQLKEMQLRNQGILKGPGIYYSSAPPSPQALDSSQRVAALLHLTADEDRITGGCWYPISSFVDLVTSVGEFKFMLLHVIDFPSVWSIIKHAGVYSGWNFGGYGTESHPYATTGLPLYRFSLRLNMNGQPAINAIAAVVAPHPPLDVSAGIVGIYAESPSNPSQRVFIQVVASQRGSAP